MNYFLHISPAGIVRGLGAEDITFESVSRLITIVLDLEP